MKGIIAIMFASLVLVASLTTRSCCNCKPNLETGITKAATEVLAGNDSYQNVEVKGDHLDAILTGSVPSSFHRDEAELLVSQSIPAGRVLNQLEVSETSGTPVLAETPKSNETTVTVVDSAPPEEATDNSGDSAAMGIVAASDVLIPVESAVSDEAPEESVSDLPESEDAEMSDPAVANYSAGPEPDFSQTGVIEEMKAIEAMKPSEVASALENEAALQLAKSNPEASDEMVAATSGEAETELVEEMIEVVSGEKAEEPQETTDAEMDQQDPMVAEADAPERMDTAASESEIPSLPPIIKRAIIVELPKGNANNRGGNAAMDVAANELAMASNELMPEPKKDVMKSPMSDDTAAASVKRVRSGWTKPAEKKLAASQWSLKKPAVSRLGSKSGLQASFELDLAGRVLFNTNSTYITSQELRQLTRLADDIIASGNHVPVVISGYADYRGDQQYNRDLSESRAIEVRNTLIRLGVKRTVIRVHALGELAKPRHHHNLREDRRVEISYARA